MPTLPDRTLRDLGWPELLAGLAARTATARGRERALALPFLDRKDELEASFDRIDEARELLRKELAAPLAGVEDVREPLARAAKAAVLEPGELVACARLIRAAARVRGHYAGHRAEAPTLALAAETLPGDASLAHRIEGAFEPSGRLKDTASATLASLRERARAAHREVKERLDAMLRDETFAMYLRDSYYSIRNDRYVVPVNSSFRAQVPGLVHNASNSGQTIFVEPRQIVDLGNELSIAESLAAEEERRILAELSGALGARAAELEQAIEVLAELDLAEASGRLANDLDAARPSLVEGRAGFRLAAARHPLLALQGKKVVANDVLLGDGQRALVVSGPNAGGKTVTITTVGLSALMARAGLPIPAAGGSSVPLYRAVHTAIGDAQDLAKDMSTFSAHVTALRGILETATEGALVLVDEIAADTDPKEGAALASAVLHELVERGVQVLVTTHLEELKALGFSDERFGNARVVLDPVSLAPTFRLELGSAGVSSALEIAARCGIPGPVLERARAALHGGGALQGALTALESERQALGRAREEATRERATLEEGRAETERLRAELADARREVEIQVREELIEMIDAAHREVGELVAKLAAAPKTPEAVKVHAELKTRGVHVAKERDRLVARAEAAEQNPGAPPPPKVLPGARVRVATLGRDAEVVEVGKDWAVVAVGPMKARVALADLAPIAGKAAPSPAPFADRKKDRAKRAEEAAPRPITAGEPRCDVRGLRAEDALREVELFLDRCYSGGDARVVIVHGHGTGALKKLLREALSISPYVGAFRAGEGHEGGDGVTVVELKG